MKRYNTILASLWLTVAALLLPACADDLSEGAPVPGASPAGTAAEDSCYINLRLVSGHATRAVTAATAAENAVYDGILCIFQGTTADAAILKTATTIDQLIANPGTAGTSVNIHVTQRLAIGTHNYASNLYVLAMLNTTTTGLYAKDGKLYKATKTISNGTMTVTNTNLTGSTLAQMQALPLDSVGSTDEHVGLYMSNANGLVPITPANHLFDTPDQVSGTPLTITVERAAARLSVTNDIPAGTVLSNINLDGNTSRHPLINRMAWVPVYCNSGAFAVGGGSASTATPETTPQTTLADRFALYQQPALQSGDAVYIGPNNITATKTQVIVELQLKEGSFLLGDCYSFQWSGNALYTSEEALINYFMDGWIGQQTNPIYDAISGWTADQVFLNAKVTLLTDGTVDVDLLSGKTGLTTAEATALNTLANTLAGLTTGFRDGKMYYTFDVADPVVRNSAYDLRLVEQAEYDIRHTAATFRFNLGTTGQTATFSNNTASLFTSNSVTVGSNLTIYGTDNKDNGQTIFGPTAEHSTADNDVDYIKFLIDPVDDWTFTPSQVSFNTTRYGTDGGKIDVYWINNDGTLTTLATGEQAVVPVRDNSTPSVLNWTHGVTPDNDGDGQCGLCLVLYNLKTDKRVGFSDIVITGTLSKASGIAEPTKSITGIGRNAP